MVEVRQLQPHEPMPESGRFLVVMRRFGEDDPQATVTELITADGGEPPVFRAAIGPDGAPMEFDAAVRYATKIAEGQDYPAVYALDRTAGPREREVLQHRGDHTVHMDKLQDQDDGDSGTDLRDRPVDAGYNR